MCGVFFVVVAVVFLFDCFFCFIVVFFAVKLSYI